MEQEARSFLIEELDKSLLAHTAALGRKEGGPSIADAYGLQGMAELHYYLKVEHEFTAAEVDALLQFTDPLEVAQACWEENDHKHSFPICEILGEISAHEKFSLRAEQEQLVEAAKDAMGQEMEKYCASLLKLSKDEIIQKSKEIAVMQDALNFMRHDYTYEKGDAEALLRMDGPLRFVAHSWPDDIVEAFDVPEMVSESIATARAYQQDADIAFGKPAQWDKSSLRGQLSAAIQEVSQHPPQEGRTHRETNTPNL